MSLNTLPLAEHGEAEKTLPTCICAYTRHEELPSLPLESVEPAYYHSPYMKYNILILTLPWSRVIWHTVCFETTKHYYRAGKRSKHRDNGNCTEIYRTKVYHSQIYHAKIYCAEIYTALNAYHAEIYRAGIYSTAALLLRRKLNVRTCLTMM